MSTAKKRLPKSTAEASTSQAPKLGLATGSARWFHAADFYGHAFDALVETTMNGGWRVTLENINTCAKTARKFKGEGARERAIDSAKSVLLPAPTADML